MAKSLRMGKLISNVCHIGNRGGGVLAENLAVSGTNGDGFLYNDVTLPGDNGKEIMGRFTYIPPGLTLTAYEDGSASASAADGTYVAQYQLYVDYIATGASTTPVTFVFGTVQSAVTWTEASDVTVLNASSSATSGTSGTISWTETSDSGSVNVSIKVNQVISWTEANDVISIIAHSDSPDLIVGNTIINLRRRRRGK